MDSSMKQELEKAEKLLKWALQICNEIQSKKTYGTRFPETAELGHEIQKFLNEKDGKG